MSLGMLIFFGQGSETGGGNLGQLNNGLQNVSVLLTVVVLLPPLGHLFPRPGRPFSNYLS